MSDLTGAAPPTRRLFGGDPSVQATPIFSAGPVETETLPDEAADYADVEPTKLNGLDEVNEVTQLGIPAATAEALGEESSAVAEPDASAAIEEPATADEETDTMPLSHLELDRLSVEELKKQQEEIERALEEKTRAEKAEVIAQIKQVAETYGVTVEEIVEAMGGIKVKRKGVKATMKYRDPVSGTEWSGRGKEPVWLRGRDRNDFLIQSA